MISITRLYCNKPTSGDPLRYERSSRGPVVVWNCTRRCNLKCVHCYAQAGSAPADDELTTAEAREMIRDLAAFKVPVLLFSGGEPLMRDDILDLVQYAREVGIRPVLSTNGVTISPSLAGRIKDAGVAYVGISLDGVGDTNDAFRGVKGAFDAALRGFESCIAIGQKVGLRLTLTRSNVEDLAGIFDLIEDMGIPRACFYHLVYSGRGGDIVEQDLTREQTRAAVDLIIDRTADLNARGGARDILTVDNHCDGPFLYSRLLREKAMHAADALRLLEVNGGNRSGIGIGCIDEIGQVHPDQFWRECILSSVRDRPFSEIWADESHPMLAGLRDRKRLLKGRCAQENCRWVDVCNGNFRARAVALYGDPWMQDPACYLTDEEIRR